MFQFQAGTACAASALRRAIKRAVARQRTPAGARHPPEGPRGRRRAAGLPRKGPRGSAARRRRRLGLVLLWNKKHLFHGVYWTVSPF